MFCGQCGKSLPDDANPWIVAGFGKDLERLWKSQRGAFITAVDERRKEATKAAAASAGK